MSVKVNEYVDTFLNTLDSFISDNLGSLTATELSQFYATLFDRLRNNYFGGAWGFEGVTEFLVFRTLYYIAREKYPGEPRVVNVTKDIRAFYFRNAGRRGLVLSAGRPLNVDDSDKKKRMWPDILVYEPKGVGAVADIARVHSAIEVKAYPSNGYRGIVDTLERLEKIRRLYGVTRLAFIVYDYPVRNKKASKILRYLMGEDVEGYKPLPKHIDVIVLSATTRKIKDLLWAYV